jgi:hypothetical protein
VRLEGLGQPVAENNEHTKQNRWNYVSLRFIAISDPKYHYGLYTQFHRVNVSEFGNIQIRISCLRLWLHSYGRNVTLPRKDATISERNIILTNHFVKYCDVYTHF